MFTEMLEKMLVVYRLCTLHSPAWCRSPLALQGVCNSYHLARASPEREKTTPLRIKVV